MDYIQCCWLKDLQNSVGEVLLQLVNPSTPYCIYSIDVLLAIVLLRKVLRQKVVRTMWHLHCCSLLI